MTQPHSFFNIVMKTPMTKNKKVIFFTFPNNIFFINQTETPHQTNMFTLIDPVIKSFSDSLAAILTQVLIVFGNAGATIVSMATLLIFIGVVGLAIEKVSKISKIPRPVEMCVFAYSKHPFFGDDDKERHCMLFDGKFKEKLDIIKLSVFNADKIGRSTNELAFYTKNNELCGSIKIDELNEVERTFEWIKETDKCYEEKLKGDSHIKKINFYLSDGSGYDMDNMMAAFKTTFSAHLLERTDDQ